MGDYICKICRKPIEAEGKYAVMMDAFNMPKDGGAHQACLSAGSEPQLAHPNTPHPEGEV